MNADDYVVPKLSALADRWWLVVARGAVAIAFGLVAILAPQISVLALVILWGSYALVDGVLNLVSAPLKARAGGRWGWLLFEGLASIAAGLLTFAWPGITALVVLTFIAIRAVLGGIAEIAVAVRLRDQITDEWRLASAGILSVVFGVLLFAFPRAGAIGLMWMVGSYALLFGLLLVGLGFRLNSWRPALQ
jgi:uncharacterized membrane protein HdeD (DUF308 family)